MEALRDTVERLSIWAEEQDLGAHAVRNVAAWFQNAGGAIGGWTAAEVRPEFCAQSLCFASALLPYPYVTTYLDLCAPDGTEIGNYRLITALDGDADGDYFVIDLDKADYEQRREAGS